ncbi:hypothetical protein MIND_01110600 [Mycena indigotica]|uniref:DNA mismatch repair protein PMS1 n=1 Tax=Mycena indigotica TaxID=2126181 RepID=A0A8H6SB38_9AGAR|nr:uncharacterized protein MIND_01110600 [Mycena indigotica]KAF7295702.1 hypothetical protein MIND_01110600 [Mycena indigotica]
MSDRAALRNRILPALHQPGQLCGGRPCHQVFRDHIAPCKYNTTAALEKYLNKALELYQRPKLKRLPELSISNEKLVLTQSDMYACNFGVDTAGNPVVLDFQQICWLPESLELYTLLRTTGFAWLVAEQLYTADECRALASRSDLYEELESRIRKTRKMHVPIRNSFVYHRQVPSISSGTNAMSPGKASGIRAIDKSSIHHITSGQVVIDLQTAVKDSYFHILTDFPIDIRFKNHGLNSIEVVDNGGGIEEGDWDAIGLKHHTSKLATLADLDTVQTFGFRGEALSSLCALCESVTVSTTTKPPMGTTIDLDSTGKVKGKSKTARQRGTTVTLHKLFSPLPVRRKELERHAKREFGKAVALLHAYALGPCARKGVKMAVSNQPDKGQKSTQFRTSGTQSIRDVVTAVWGTRALDNIVDLDITFAIERDKHAVKRLSTKTSTACQTPIQASLRGLVSAFAPGSGRPGPDRQVFYVNGRPCLLPKVQKTITEVYRTFNAPGTQAPVVIADLVLPTDAYDVNVSPDKRTIYVHHEIGLVEGLKAALEAAFAPGRSTFGVSSTQSNTPEARAPDRTRTRPKSEGHSRNEPILLDNEEDSDEEGDEDEEDEEEHPDLLHHLEGGAKAPRGKDSQATTNDSPFLKPISTAATSARNTKTTTKASTSSKATGKSLQTKLPFASATVKTNASSSTSRVVVPTPATDNQRALQTPSATGSSRVSSPDSEPEGNDESIVTLEMDTSQTTWGRALGLESRTKRKESSPLGSEEKDEGDSERPLKRQKSEFSESYDDLDPEEQEEMELDPEADTEETASSPHPALTKQTTMSSSQQPRTPSATQKGPRQQLRTMLATFAGPAASQKKRAVSEEGEDELQSSEEEEENGDGQQHIEVDDETQSSQLIDLSMDNDSDDDEETTPFNPSTPTRASAPVLRPEVVRTLDEDGTGEMVLRVELDNVIARWERLKMELQNNGEQDVMPNITNPHEILKAAGLGSGAADIDFAAQALSRTINKSDFASMDILGQFNLGFVVVRRQVAASAESPAMDDLFIVDQHAADEKYNFETLQQTTRIKSQKLFRPRPLELTASDEMLALEKIEVLRQNGFEVEVQTEAVELGDEEEAVETPATTPKLAPRGADSPYAGRPRRHDSSLRESPSNVCHAGLSEKCDDWDAADRVANDLGCATYGDDGPAVELPSWATDNAPSGGYSAE